MQLIAQAYLLEVSSCFPVYYSFGGNNVSVADEGDVRVGVEYMDAREEWP